MQQTMAVDNRVDLLDSRVNVSMSVNDLRILANCFRALEYQGRVDDESYLDADAQALKGRVESAYQASLRRLGIW
jgi:hypothetical protein